MSGNASEVTLLLNAAGAGEQGASEKLLPLVYEELRRLARGYMNRERAGQTLQATALVHEAYLRLVGDGDVAWSSRRHFFGAAALAMRRILVERYRQKKSLKQGGERQRVELDHAAELAAPDADGETDLALLDGALDRLAAYDPRKAEVVMLRCFAGLDHDQVAAALGVAPATVRRDWTFAKAWLARELRNSGGAASSDGAAP